MSDVFSQNPKNGIPLRTPKPGRDFFIGMNSLWRRKWIPLLGLCAGIALGLLILLVSTPQYRASAQVMIGGGLESTMATETAIIRSPAVLGQVARILNLYQDKSFRRPGWEETVSLRNNSETAVQERVLHRLSALLHTRVLADTSIIEVTVLHTNPETAAQIVNAIVDAYRDHKMDEKFQQSRQLGTWLGKRLEEVRQGIQIAKTNLEKFQAEHGLMGLNGPDLRAQRLEALNTEISATEGAIAALSSRLSEAQKLTKKGTAGKLTDVQKSSRIESLKKTLSDLNVELAEMQERYGDAHPKIISQYAEIARVERDIAHETRNVVGGIGQDLNTARARLQALEEQTKQISMGYGDDSRLQAQARDLQSEVASGQRLYEQFVLKYQDVMAQNEMNLADVRVISMANIPSTPDQYNRLGLVAMLGFAGFMIGLSFVAARIIWNQGFTSAQQLEGMTGYPVFAAVPMATGRTDAVHHHVTQDPAAILAESLRSLRVSLRLRGEVGRRPRTVAFTSTLPDEGKTSLSVMLATIAAKSGERVCVVDCDLRRPSLHKAFGIGNARGLADYLSDRMSLDEVIHRKDPSGVHLITGKSVPSYSLTLLTSGRMERLIATLREQYDLVILDAPSSLAFADARVLSGMVDQTLYVVSWNRTRRSSVLASLKNYADLGYEPLALVLNKVDLEEYLRDSAAAVVYQYGHEQGIDTNPAFVT